MTIIFLILLTTLLFLNIYKTKRSLHMLQQNLYNENNRYIKWIIKNLKQFINPELLVIIIMILNIVVFYNYKSVLIINELIISIVLIAIGFRKKKEIENDQNKKKLVITARIKRLITTITILFLIPTFIIGLKIDNMKYCLSMFLIIEIMTYLNPIIIFIAKIINTPIEKCVYIYYKSKAQKKLKSMSNLKIIGITGSYGKTSSKNILSDILNIKYNALPTPKNLNTYNGLIMTVNNYMDKFTDIFIAEMGAYVRGEIAGLCKLVKPQYGILTTIGKAHLESFGSEENIVKGKFELIESLPKNGFAILNGDDPKYQMFK